ncbi:MAG: pyridoxamine 5'-phosphate oxidase family protein [Oscillospiraceae bacterium]|nr:pyridoxamine 5'-phosphate oxidase family protein [Oscillospiraceae bacterium]
MFRQLRRKRQEVPREECSRILAAEKRGVLAVSGDDGYPYAVPVNFYYDETEERIYLHGAKEGHKLDAIRGNDKVCFTVWDRGRQEDGDWSFHVTSVVAFGRAELMEDGALALEKLRALGLKYYPDADEVEEELRRSQGYVQMLAICIEHMTGKLVHER